MRFLFILFVLIFMINSPTASAVGSEGLSITQDEPTGSDNRLFTLSFNEIRSATVKWGPSFQWALTKNEMDLLISMLDKVKEEDVHPFHGPSPKGGPFSVSILLNSNESIGFVAGGDGILFWGGKKVVTVELPDFEYFYQVFKTRRAKEAADHLKNESFYADETPPLLYITLNDNSSSITVEATRELNRFSVLKSIKASLRTREMPKGEGTVHEEIIWKDNAHFIVKFHGFDKGESLRVSFDGVTSVAGESFQNKEQPFRNNVVLFMPRESPRLIWLDEQNSLEITRWLSSEAGDALQHVKVNHEPFLLVYSESGNPFLISKTTGTKSEIRFKPLYNATKPFGNDYGIELMFSDRLQGETTFVAVGNKSIYRLNWRTGQSKKLYDSVKPIYALSSSPNGRQFAVLTPSDNFIGADADLLVFNSDGKRIALFIKVAAVNHSDGILFPYPLTWENDFSVLLPKSGENGMDFVSLNINNGILHDWEPLKLTMEERLMLKNEIHERVDVIRIARKANSHKMAIEIYDSVSKSEIWILDSTNRKVQWAGAGTLLGWSDRGEIIIAEPSDKRFIFPA